MEGEGNERKFTLSFSSEEPYERWFGIEILDHSEQAADLTRINEIGCLLFNHNRDDVIGKINRAWVENNRGYAEVEFDADEKSEMIYQKVKNGTLKGVSVGYRIDSFEEVSTGKTSADGRFTGPCEIARKWMPYEISIVSVPADATVGVGRGQEENQNFTGGNNSMDENARNNNEEQQRGQNSPENTENKSVSTTDTPAVSDEQRAITAERTRIASITAMCRDFDMDDADLQRFIQDGTTEDNVRTAILDKLCKEKSPVSAGVHVIEAEEDKFRAAAADGLLLRMGAQIDKPADGANEFRGMSLRDIAVECLAKDGGNTNKLLRMSRDELYANLSRDFFNPSAAFPAIMDAAIKKTIVEEYQKVPTTFQAWTKKGSVTDFKATPDHNYLLGGVGDFELVPENGELKHSIPKTHLLPQRKIDTYGKQFSMSRQAFINDDIGFLAEIPAAYTRAAKRTIDKAVYSILFNNPSIFDHTALFHAKHKNLITTGSAPSQTSIQDIILLAQGQTDPFDEPIYEVPKYLIVPMGYEFILATIFRSAQVVGSSNNDINPLYNYPLQVIQTPWLNSFAGAGEKPWFMVTDPATSKSIQVDYLNGQETPTFRRSEKAGQLGFVWDIWLDWGITAVDYRGIYKNPGVA